ncbi:MAG: response regulator [Acidobacteria bacterium]|nr:response regulator [Acidobacteriota bacterium]
MAAQPSTTVLVVDDEEPIRDYLSNVLKVEGYACRTFGESAKALDYLASSDHPADLMLTDIKMPGMTGIELLRSVKELKPAMPVILVSGLYELALAIEALEYGADDYLKKPVRPADVLTAVGKYLSNTQARESAVQEALEEFVAAGEDPHRSAHIAAIFRTMGIRRYETFQHSKRVAAYSRLFGELLGLPPQRLDRLELGALLHDIGKIGIPRNVLLKPGPLTDEEWRVMKTHPDIGHRLMARFPELTAESEVVKSHHERWDGKGYPDGLEGEQIPLFARLFSIVDTYDAVTSDRPYRPAQGVDAAKAVIDKGQGAQFDPRLVQTFLAIPEIALEMIRERYPDNVPDEC